MPGCQTTPVRSLFELAEARHVPLNMMLELTYRCNESCLHCYLPETQGVRDPRVADELSFSEWSRVLGELAEAGTLYLTVTGGEVCLRSDLGRILARARELSFAVEVFTNATLVTPAVADEWASLDIASVGVSCYSPEAAAHDRVTRLKGSWEKTVAGVKLLRERGIGVTLKCPLMKLNWGSRRALAELASELGVSWKFDPMIVPRNDGSDIPVRLSLGDDRLREAYEDPELSPPEDVLGAGPPAPGDSTCSAGRTSGAIGPFGDLVPCIQWMVPAGNVRERPFRELWERGAIMRRARSITAGDVKPCPECGQRHFMHCSGMSQLQRGDPLVPSSDVCRLTRAMRAIQRNRPAAPDGSAEISHNGERPESPGAGGEHDG